MPCFSELFRAANSPVIDYEGQKIMIADRFPVKNGDRLIIKLESTNSEYKQGFSIDITGHCEMDGSIYQHGKGIDMIFWEDTMPNEFTMTVFTEQGYVWVQNFWEHINYQGVPSIHKAHNGAAMVAEEIENGRRYRCNDGKPDDDFDDIVFTVQRTTD